MLVKFFLLLDLSLNFLIGNGKCDNVFAQIEQIYLYAKEKKSLWEYA